MLSCDPQNSEKALKSDLIAEWLRTEWKTDDADDVLTVWLSEEMIHARGISKMDTATEFSGYNFSGYRVIEDCPVVTPSEHFDGDGKITYQMGAFVYTFTPVEGSENTGSVEIPILATHYTDNVWDYVVMGAVPRSFLPILAAFAKECQRLAYALEPTNQVIVIGGRQDSFEPTVVWDEIILPDKLKQDIQHDTQSFFRKGAEVYKRLNLKPFRKLLLAGVPGTGKTMICSALAKWALSENYLVIYVSSARKKRDENIGSTFDKIDHALSVASSSKVPSLIILEEIDAYLHDNEKALILNVLDGSEGAMNDKGTLLIATTNYPEAIDDRIIKRPGRLDRVFIIPETRRQPDAEKMLQQYLGSMWQEEHAALAPKLVGYPGAFIREVAVYALTQVAYEDLDTLSLALLESSFNSLKEQIDARDDFLQQRGNIGFGAKVNGNATGA